MNKKRITKNIVSNYILGENKEIIEAKRIKALASDGDLPNEVVVESITRCINIIREQSTGWLYIYNTNKNCYEKAENSIF